MLYHAYELQRSWLNSASALASISAGMLNNPSNPFGYMGMGPMVANALDVFAHATAHYGKPEFGITEVEIGGEPPLAALDRFGQAQARQGLQPAGAQGLLQAVGMAGRHQAVLRRVAEQTTIETGQTFLIDLLAQPVLDLVVSAWP